MMRFRLGALWIALCLAVAAAPASALTVPVVGGPGLDQGQVCVSGTLCPGTPSLSLTGPAAATGSVTYNAGPSTVDITLTLTQNADFGGLAQMLAGTTFSALGVPVISFPFGSGIQVVQIGGAVGLASPLNLNVTGGASVLANTPAVSGLTCSFGTGSDQCGVSFGASGLSFQATALAQNYDAFVTFNVNVPEPGTLVTLAFGVAGLAFAGRSRRA
jgi:hypothetical protein